MSEAPATSAAPVSDSLPGPKRYGRYVLIDRYVLWELSRTTAGLAANEVEPRPDSRLFAGLTARSGKPVV